MSKADCNRGKTNPRNPAQNGGSGSISGKDGYHCETVSDDFHVATPRRTSRKFLLELEPTLSDLDWKILKIIRRCRVILGRQIGRLYFDGYKTTHASTVATNRKLKALTDLGLIQAVNQKIDCRLRGYVAYIYYLTEAGERILQIHLGEPETRKRNIEPSTVTLAHTVSVSECYVQAVETCRRDDLKLTEIQLEPECWRPYQRNYKQCILKPDLAFVTEKQDWSSHDEPWYEMRWFVEMDLNTENIQTILTKCRRYYDYYKSDMEQKLHDDVFPLVVWIVKTESRRNSLIRHICGNFPQYPRIFAVILPDEFTALVRDELDLEGYLCPDTNRKEPRL